jgi:hypothetical protein
VLALTLAVCDEAARPRAAADAVRRRPPLNRRVEGDSPC